MWLIDVLKDITRLIKQGEETAITFISTVIPWLVPVVPAYITYNHAIGDLQFWWPVAICVGVSVEGLGLTSMYRVFQFLEHNRKYKDAKNKSPWGIPAATYAVYLAIVLTVNVVLDWQKGVNGYHVAAIALLTLLSLPAGVLIAVMAVHEERVAEHKAVLAERREQRQNRQAVPEPVLGTNHGSQNGSDGSGRTASQFREQIWGILERDWSQNHTVTGTTEIANELKLDKHRAKSYIWGQRNEWMAARGIAQPT